MCAVGIFFAAQVGLLTYYFVRQRARQTTWGDLLARLTWTDKNNIDQVALELVDESGQRRVLKDEDTPEPADLWALIGGLAGLEVLQRNSEVLVELAFYLQRWYPGAVVIAEQLRMDARELKWHVARLRGAAKTGNLQVSFPFYAQRAVVSYYVMTHRLLTLYESCSFAMLSELQRTLWRAGPLQMPNRDTAGEP
jgi:hypothetical protein